MMRPGAARGRRAALLLAIVLAIPLGALTGSTGSVRPFEDPHFGSSALVVPAFASIPLGGILGGIAVDPLLDRVFVTVPNWNSVVVLDGTNGHRLANLTVGSHPIGIVEAPGLARLFVANNGSATVSVVDARNETVSASIPVGTGPAGICFDPYNGTVYSANFGSGNVSAINVTRELVVASIPVLSGPLGIAGAAGTVVVTHPGHNVITRIDEKKNAVLSTQTVGTGPYGVVMPPGKTIVSNRGSNTVTIFGFDPTHPTNSRTLSVGSHPEGLAFNPANSLFYVADSGSAKVALFGATGGVLATFPERAAPAVMAVNPGSGTVYVGSPSNGTIATIPAAAGLTISSTLIHTGIRALAVDNRDGVYLLSESPANVVAVLPSYSPVGDTFPTDPFVVPGAPWAMAFDSLHDRVFITEAAAGRVISALPSNGSVLANATVGTDPEGIALDIGANLLAVTNHGSGTVSLLRLSNLSLLATIAVGASPTGIAFSNASGAFYVANSGSNNVSVISASLRAVTATLAVGVRPTAVAYDPTDRRIFVADSGSAQLTVFRWNNSRMATIGVGTDPEALAFNPGNGQLYVANNGSNAVGALSGDNFAKSVSFNVAAPSTLAVDPTTGAILVGSFAGNLTLLRWGKSAVVGSLSYTPGGNIGEQLDPASGNLFVQEGTTVAVQRLATGAPVAAFPSHQRAPNYAGGNYFAPDGFLADPNNGRVYVAESTNSVDVYNATTGAFVHSIFVYAPTGLALNPVNGSIYAATRSGYDIIDPVLNHVAKVVNLSTGGGEFIVIDTAANALVLVYGPGASVVNLSTNTLVQTISLSGFAFGAAGTPTSPNIELLEGNRHRGASVVRLLNMTTGTDSKAVTIGSPLRGLAFDPFTGEFAVLGSQNLSLLSPVSQKVLHVFPLPFPAGNLARVLATGKFIVVDGAAIGFNGTGYTVAGTPPSSWSPIAISGAAVGSPFPLNGAMLVAGWSADAYDEPSSQIASGAVAVPGFNGNAGPEPKAIVWTYTVAPGVPVAGTPWIALESADAVVAPGSLFGQVPVGHRPVALAWDPPDQELFVANFGSDNVTVVDLTNGRVVTTIAVGHEPAGICYDGARSRVVVANFGSDTVSVISTVTDRVTSTVPVGADPVALTANPLDGRVYVANAGSGNVTLVNDSSGTTAGSITVGAGPAAVVFDPLDGAMVVACSGSGQLVALRGGAPAYTVMVGPGLDGAAVDPYSGDLWVTIGGLSSIFIVVLGS
jgi:YVTN family beta-propeller protein